MHPLSWAAFPGHSEPPRPDPGRRPGSGWAVWGVAAPCACTQRWQRARRPVRQRPHCGGARGGASVDFLHAQVSRPFADRVASWPPTPRAAAARGPHAPPPSASHTNSPTPASALAPRSAHALGPGLSPRSPAHRPLSRPRLPHRRAPPLRRGWGHTAGLAGGGRTSRCAEEPAPRQGSPVSAVPGKPGRGGSSKTTPRGQRGWGGHCGGRRGEEAPTGGTHVTLLLRPAYTGPRPGPGNPCSRPQAPQAFSPQPRARHPHWGPDTCSSRAPCPEPHCPTRGAQCAASTRPHRWHVLRHATSLETWVPQALLAPQSSTPQD